MQTLTKKLQKISLVFALLICSFGGVALAASPCDNVKNQHDLSVCLQNNGIEKDINTIINFLSAGAGVVIVGSIIVGGIQYAIAGSNTSAVGAAKKRITDALIALLAFFFIYAFLDWLVPGGLLFK